jgi:hypothetical protein
MPAGIPVVKEVSEVEVQENFLRVKREVKELVDTEMERILGDPGLKGMVLKNEKGR